MFIYIHIGNRVYGQRVWIPVGIDCAPLLANPFLEKSVFVLLWIKGYEEFTQEWNMEG